jgi:hypothetical protein
MARSWPLVIILWSAVAAASAEETPAALPQEAPEAVFETTIGSSDVEMYLDGSWKAGVSGVVGFLLRSRGGAQPLDYYPNLPMGWEFAQDPQLTFSVWLERHYFVEYTVLGSFEDNSFRAGYQGDGLLRELVIGNSGIAIDPYPYIAIPATGDSSLGIEATLATERTRHEMLLRYDNNSSGSKVFVGLNEVQEVRLALPAYQQGMRFRLPDSRVDGLRVYLEDPTGTISGSDGRTYRLATTTDATADDETGIITLKIKPAGRVLAWYTKGGLAVGDAGLGRAIDPESGGIAVVNAGGVVDPSATRNFDFGVGALWPSGPNASTLQVAVQGDTALLLHDRGVFSLFDMQGTYLVDASMPTDSWRTRADLVRRGGSERTKTAATLTVQPALGRVVVTRDTDARSLRNLYPLIANDPDPGTPHSLYGPFRDDSDGLYSAEILLAILTPITGYFLEPDILSGSVVVTRNGSPETRFAVDTRTGQVTFLTPIAPTDRIEITYKKKGALLDNGDLVLGWGNSFAFSDSWKAQLATGFRWNALPGAYSEKPFTRTGAVLVSGGITGETDNLAVDAQAAVSYAHPDTTGRLRLAGMESSGLEVSLDENLALPAFDPGGGGTRGRLLYKDYREYGLLGSYTLRDLSWDIPSSQVYPYETGSKVGPYNVAGGASSGSDRSLVIDFNLDPSGWAGFEIPVAPGQGLPDLSSLEELITEYRMYSLSGSVDVTIQIGDVAEDVDGDGELDKETSASATGFLFNDTDNGAALLVGNGPKGEGNDRIDTEDLDADRHLQTTDGSLVTRALGDTPTGAWQVDRRTFATDADRDSLRRARAIRVFVRENGGLAASGRLLIDRLHLAGSTFAATAPTDGSVAVREVPEGFAQDQPAKTLEKAFPDVVRNIFHASGQQQKVLEIATDATAGEWTVRGYTSAGTEGARYGEVVHYLRLPQWNAGQPLSFELVDDRGKGITWSWTPSVFADWREVRVDIEKRRLTINGTRPTGSTVRVETHGSLVQLRVRSKGGDGSNALVYVDELHMASPIGSLGAAARTDTQLTFPGAIVKAGGVPVVSDLRVREIASTVTPGFSPLYGRPEEAWSGSSRTEVSMGLPLSHLDAHFVADWTDLSMTLGGGHTVQTTVGPVTVEDTFDIRAPGPDATFDRESRFRVAPAPGTTLDASAGAEASDERLTQHWTASLASAATRTRASLVAGLDLATLDYRHRETGYFDSWALGYRLYVPADASLVERSSNATGELALEPAPAGISLQITPATRSVPDGDGRDLSATVMARLAVPYALDDRGTIVTAAYQRSVETTAAEPRVGEFADDWRAAAGQLQDQWYAYAGLPFAEIYAGEDAFRDATRDLTSAAYRPQVQLELTRRPGSSVLHLFAPVRLAATVGRDLEKEGALYSSRNSYEVAYQSNAVNLFGTLGAYPTFTFYDIDEVANSVTLALLYDGDTLASGDLHVDNLVSLEARSGDKLSVSNRFALTGEKLNQAQNTSEASYTWFVRPESGVRLPLLAQDLTREAYYVHDEAIAVTATSQSHPFTAMARHRSEIRLGDHGYIAATLALGTDFESFRGTEGREWVMRLAAQAGIEGLIRFGSGEPRREGEPRPQPAAEGRPPR